MDDTPDPVASTAAVPAKRIRMLDEAVINRIAAGEVIQRPANALKEMIENSLDAGSTSIVITVKAGGMKLLQIQDNGCGIGYDDLDIVCERFTTSKLESFDDLKSISTFGFRGEALASISHVAHVTIITKTADAKCAYKACYSDGKLVPASATDTNARPKPCAGNKGTQITVEDLFYNVNTRRKALKSPSDEHAKIVEVVGRYAVHNGGVSFTLKKHGETTADVRTVLGGSKIDAIRSVYGAAVARELLQLSAEERKLELKVEGLVSNADYSVKKGTYLFFINNRLVDCPSIRKALETVYATYLPKGGFPFVYLSLTMPGANIDVNVHPTKKEVHFLNEDAIVEAVQKAVEGKLLGSNSSRTFYTQALLPGSINSSLSRSNAASTAAPNSSASTGAGTGTSASPLAAGSSRPYAHQMIRTDDRLQTLDAFVAPLARTPTATAVASRPVLAASASEAISPVVVVPSKRPFQDDSLSATSDTAMRRVPSDTDAGGPRPMELTEPIADDEELGTRSGAKASDATAVSAAAEPMDRADSLERDNSDIRIVESDGIERDAFHLGDTGGLQQAQPQPSKLKKKMVAIKKRPVHLTSIKALLSKLESESSESLCQMFQKHTFVGCIKPTLAMMQYSTDLYIVNVSKFSWHLFYELALRSFSNFGTVSLNPSPALYDVLMLALNDEDSGWTEEDGDKDELAKFMTSFFCERAEMLQDYFAICISSDGKLESLPALLEDYVPDLHRIPMFFLRLATEVDWDSEQGCFETIARQLASLYAVKPSANPLADENEDISDNQDIAMSRTRWKWTVEHVLFPAFRAFHPPATTATDGTILQVANLTDLYKVFERC